ncbi:MAG: tRNA dihydrouridine synthase DusB [Methylothermaceae bacteria B42]|nr:MAG: tRNA dihydrouridine synthase DusB [Methylothermaceae bacteria B42]HHJ39239.1 tRNA dihydrouridine synthase DusB [Methylothermaceae bacterium]
MQIGPYSLSSPVILAPMAGVTDLPFRRLCRQFGAGLAVSEMITSRPQLQNHHRTRQRADHSGEPHPRSIQILGVNPKEMAECARRNVDLGAQIIDINMGCPAKKVCRVAAGSALLRDEKKVAAILEAVVGAVPVPVTLKIRTGWDRQNKNAVNIAKIAENSGIQALAIHGRTRACGFQGKAEYDTIAAVKCSVTIPVIANGDIDSAAKAKQVLATTGADAVMIGRAAQGRPWLFREISGIMANRESSMALKREALLTTILEHVAMLHDFYGPEQGVRIARKHIGWYLANLALAKECWRYLLDLKDPALQLQQLEETLKDHLS